ncbi:MAG TPA: DUF6541 family protein [Naasia sp.]|jgi:hypothetical protein
MGVVLLPGLLVAIAARMRGLPALAMAGPISVTLTAGTAILLEAVGIPFAWGWIAAAALLLAAALAAALRPWRRKDPADGSPAASRWSAPLTATIASSALIGLVAFGRTDAAAPNTTYDGVFHLNAVAYILDTGRASSLFLYRLTHPGTDLEFYPAAWHALAAEVTQISGAPVPLAANAVWIAGAPIWTSGCIFLATVLWRDRPHLSLVQWASGLGSACFAAFPYLLLGWGTLFPTALAYQLLPVGLALTVRLVRSGTAADRRSSLLLGAAWGCAVALAHPRSLFSFGILVAPLLIQALVGWTRGRLGSPGGARTVTLVLGGGAAAAVVIAGTAAAYVWSHFDVASRPIADRLNGGPATARQTFGQSLLQALGNAPVVAPSDTATAPDILLALAVAGGLVAAVALGREWWLAAGLVAVCLLYAAAAGSNSDAAKLLTGLWYKDKYRLISLLPVLAAPLIGLAAGALAMAGDRVRAGLGRVAAIGALAVVVPLSLSGGSLAGVRDGIDAVYSVPAGEKNGALLDQDELALLTEVAELVPEGGVIAGNPWNGSALTWALGGREALFPHFTGEWDADRLAVAERLDQIGADPGVCDALRRLGVTHVLRSEGLLWGGDPQAAAFGGMDRSDPASLGRLVAERGGTRLYSLDACPP